MIQTPHLVTGQDLPMPLAVELIDDAFAIDRGKLSIGGISVDQLAEEFGTPLFAYDADLFRRNLSRLRDTLGEWVDIYYSVKANPNPAVIAVFVAEGAGLEVASAAEYIRACKAGGAVDRIVFAGPGKGYEELDFVIRNGIGEIHLETDAEIETVASIGKQLGLRVSVGLRVNPISEAQGGAMRMGGKPAQFGFDEERLGTVIADVQRHPELDFKGIHLFAGTQILDADVLCAQWYHGIELAIRIGQEYGVSVRTLDLGGGLGVPYFKGDRHLDLCRLKELAAPLFRNASERLPTTRLILEPGRYLTASAGVYIARVRAFKESRGEYYAVIDGGMHHHLAASGNLGQIIKKDYPIVLANRLDEANDMVVGIAGPLCTPLDMIGRKASIPEPRAGDLIAVLQSGAYGLTASPTGFLSQPMPAEVMISGGRGQLIRQRGTFEQPISPMP